MGRRLFGEVRLGSLLRWGRLTGWKALSPILLLSFSKRQLPRINKVDAHTFLQFSPDTHPRAKNAPRPTSSVSRKPQQAMERKRGGKHWPVTAPPGLGSSVGQRWPGGPRATGGVRHLSPACAPSLATERREWTGNSATCFQ